MAYKTVIFGPAGFGTYYFLGASYFLSGSNSLAHINRFIGVSGGAFLAILLAVRIPPSEIITVMSQIPLVRFQEFWRIFLSIISNPQGSEVGLLSGVRDILKQFLDRRMLRIPTFHEIFEQFGTSLEIVATDYTNQTPIVFNRHLTPDLKVDVAFLGSISIPLFLEKIYYRNRLIVSGILTNPLPIDLLEKDEEAIVLALETPKVSDSLNIFDYFFQAMIIPMNTLQRKAIHSLSEVCPAAKLCLIEAEFRDFLGLTLKEDDIQRMITAGQIAIGKIRKDVLPKSILERYQEDPFEDEKPEPAE